MGDKDMKCVRQHFASGKLREGEQAERVNRVSEYI